MAMPACPGSGCSPVGLARRDWAGKLPKLAQMSREHGYEAASLLLLGPGYGLGQRQPLSSLTRWKGGDADRRTRRV